MSKIKVPQPKRRRFTRWIILNEVGKPDYSVVYQSRRECLACKNEWNFTDHRPCKVEIILPDKLPRAS